MSECPEIRRTSSSFSCPWVGKVMKKRKEMEKKRMEVEATHFTLSTKQISWTWREQQQDCWGWGRFVIGGE